jgi:spore coat protein U-like protein
MTGQGAYAACTVTTTGVNFGVYDVFNLVDTDSTGGITVTCTTRTRVTILIGQSANSGLMNPRQMRQLAGVELLNYDLFTMANRRNIWGDDTLGTRSQNKNVRPNRPWVATVFGRLYAGQDVSSGLYDDTVTVTILP